MPELLQIIFEQHNSIPKNSDNEIWWNASKDFVLPIAIAVLAAYVAYYIFIKETKRDKAIEERKKIEERSDKLLFFSTLIQGCLTTSVQQKNNIKDYIRLIRLNDVDFHLMTFVSLNDLTRVSNVLNLESYLLAYVNNYSADRKKSIKEFKEIIASIDFLLEIYTHIPETLKNAQIYDYERKTKFQNLFQNAYDLTGKIVLKFQNTNPPLVARLNTLYQNFINNYPGNNYDINYYHTYFFIPYNDFCTEYLGLNQPFQELLDLALLTRDGKQLYGQIKSEHQFLKEQITNDFKSIYKTLLDLRQNARNLLSEI